MLKDFRKKVAHFISPESKKETDDTVNQRVAQVLSKMDVLDYLLRDYHCTFSTEYERPEDKLTERGQLSMKMWAFNQARDPNFEYLIDWVMDTYGNETLRHAAVTPERIRYGRAQMASAGLIKREVGRLSNLYLEMLEGNKVQEFDKTKAVE